MTLHVPDVTGLDLATAAMTYAAAGWYVLPADPATKRPGSLVGREWPDRSSRSGADIMEWWTRWPHAAIALHVGRSGAVAIDVDHPEHLPAVLRSAIDTSRPPHQSTRVNTPGRGHYLWATAPGQYGNSAGGLGPGWGEVRGHNGVIIAAPSPHTHPDGHYQWATTGPLPPLPPELAAELRAPGVSGGGAAVADLKTALDSMRPGPACRHIASEPTDWPASGRYDEMTRRVMRLARRADGGCRGVADALRRLADSYTAAVADRSDTSEAAGELRRALAGALDIVRRDPMGTADCDDDDDDDGPPSGPCGPGPWSPLGPGPFDPQTRLSLPLARAVLERALPVLRYAIDSQEWILRQGDRWEVRARADRAILSVLADLMPRGNTKAAEGTPERRQADAWAYLHGGPSGVSAVAERMRDECARGDHPAGCYEARLDLDADTLWAAGVAYDLSASTEQPKPLPVQPNIPFLRSTPITPKRIPTPYWDAYLAAMWPDKEYREWAKMAIAPAVTGHPVSLPILVGDGGVGKTQFVKIVCMALGEYGGAVDPRLLRGSGDIHGSFILSLRGLRLAFIDEGPRDSRSGQEHLKYITGGSELVGNRMRGNPIQFPPVHTLVLSTNEMPDLYDEALQRRVALITCEGDKGAVAAARAALTPHLSAELPGILADLMRCAAHWLADRHAGTQDAAPGDHAHRILEIAAAQDPTMRWVRDQCDPVAADMVREHGTRSGTLYEDYVKWCRDNNINPIPKITKWGRDLTKMGYASFDHKQGSHVFKYRPLRLRRVW